MAEKKIAPKAPEGHKATAKKSPTTRVTKRKQLRKNFRKQGH